MIKGCGDIVQRGSEQEHIAQNLPSHFRLLQDDREAILWKERRPAWLNVEHHKTGKAGTFSWSVLAAANTGQAYCSPQMEKWGRRWKLFFAKRGESVEIGLEYSQGVSPVHLNLRSIN
ncbi:uncharacterized protein LOC144652324 [Oculina patagonica]